MFDWQQQLIESLKDLLWLFRLSSFSHFLEKSCVSLFRGVCFTRESGVIFFLHFFRLAMFTWRHRNSRCQGEHFGELIRVSRCILIDDFSSGNFLHYFFVSGKLKQSFKQLLGDFQVSKLRNCAWKAVEITSLFPATNYFGKFLTENLLCHRKLGN